ncbi:MAG TPA: peptide chain release factor N(5)-glutamine methyltransferase [Petrimonas sp.]|nr:MAG: protein-(glutamine-N5) methyltransferase, release factor-specific [Bacteroidia bacterium 43-41]HHV86091.1 peptide chain release factor N(5)-glutamine methyltransferase [Petrimonas sp.]
MQKVKNFIKNELKGLFSPDEINSLTRLILEKEFSIPLADVLTCKFNHLSDAEMQRLSEIVGKLKNSEPIQYILGETDFFGLTFYLDDSVLIPRPETEELVQWIVDSVKNEPLKILDIGTGSGCIAVTLAKKLPFAEVHAWDISRDALGVARKNADKNGVHLFLAEKDILQESVSDEKFDIVVSNPPYVTEFEKGEMQENVLNFEPHLAMFVSDQNALVFYEKIADFALKNLNKGGKLFFEINREKGNQIEMLLQQRGFGNIERQKDISGNERMIKAERG